MGARSLTGLLLGCSLLLTVAPAAIAKPPTKQAAKKQRVAANERITLDLHRADLRNVLRLLADVGGVNLVVGDGVDGEVTMRLKDVHWRDALRTILSVHGLAAELRANILHVAPAEHFAEQRQARATAREQCLASAPLKTRLVRVNYADAAAMARSIEATLTKRGSVSVDTRTNTLIVRDVECD